MLLSINQNSVSRSVLLDICKLVLARNRPEGRPVLQEFMQLQMPADREGAYVQASVQPSPVIPH